MINNTILVLAVLIALVPFFGISHAAKEGLSAFFALLIIALSVITEQRIQQLFRRKQSVQNFSDEAPVGVPENNSNYR